MASFSAFREGLRERFQNFRMPEWRDPPKPVRIALLTVGGILALLIVAWIVLNFLLANPRSGTPMVNWALGTFADKHARVSTGNLTHPFSDRFDLRLLEWPGRVEAEDIQLTYDLFGFLPGRPWARKLYARNGEVMLENKENDRTTFNPQALVDAVEVDNIDLKFMRRNKLREVTIVKAGGSFSSGTVSGEAVSGKGRLTFNNVRREWDGLRGAITVEGDNLKNLAELVGVSAPDTPPFDVNGELRTHQRTWSVEKLGGRVGDSDIGGVVSVDLKPKKPFLTVDLKSQKLDFDDMGVVFGLPVGADRGETTNEEQRVAKATYDRSARLIPDTHIDFARLAAVNADISFEALQVVDAPFGVNAMTMKAELRDQVLDFSRFLVRTTGQGDLDAKIRINAQDDPAKTRATGTLENLPITRIVNTTFVRGTLNGRFALNMTGSGFREAFGSATGEAGIWSNNSEVAKIATEAAGLDLGEILLLLVTDEDREYLKSRCLAGGLTFRNGLGELNPAVIDNKDSLIAASGHIDLRTEALDIEVFALPHDVSIGKVFGDIRVKGTMRNPDINALDGKTVLQAGLSALLSTIAGPLSALPFIEIGGEPDAPCAQLLADARNPSEAKTPPTKKEQPPKKS